MFIIVVFVWKQLLVFSMMNMLEIYWSRVFVGSALVNMIPMYHRIHVIFSYYKIDKTWWYNFGYQIFRLEIRINQNQMIIFHIPKYYIIVLSYFLLLLYRIFIHCFPGLSDMIRTRKKFYEFQVSFYRLYPKGSDDPQFFTAVLLWCCWPHYKLSEGTLVILMKGKGQIENVRS